MQDVCIFYDLIAFFLVRLNAGQQHPDLKQNQDGTFKVDLQCLNVTSPCGRRCFQLVCLVK